MGEEDGLYYIVMQFVEGQTLGADGGPSPRDAGALSIAIQIADALAVAHAHGIVHRDIKPANVIVTAAGQAKVLDFGLAKMLAVPGEDGQSPAARVDDPVTEVGVPYGSIGYGSPRAGVGRGGGRPPVRRLQPRRPCSTRWSPARPLPRRGTRSRCCTRSSTRRRGRSREVNPAGPRGLQPIVDRALAKEPDDRYQTMAALRDELKALMRQALARDRASSPPRPRPPCWLPQRARASWAGSLWARVVPRVLGRLRTPLRERAVGPGQEPAALTVGPASPQLGRPRPSRRWPSCPSRTCPTTPKPPSTSSPSPTASSPSSPRCAPWWCGPPPTSPPTWARTSTRARWGRSWRPRLVLTGQLLPRPRSGSG